MLFKQNSSGHSYFVFWLAAGPNKRLVILFSVFAGRVFTVSIFFNCDLAVPRPTVGHSQGVSLTIPMLITAFVLFRPEGHWEPHSEVASLSLAECPAWLNQEPSDSNSNILTH